MNLINVFNSIQETGGATYNITTSELNPKTGFIVALLGFEKTFDIPATLNEFQNVIQSYLQREIWDEIAGKDDTYLGFWIDGDKLYIDLSERIENGALAILTGVNRNQKAIWDAVLQKSIWIENFGKKVSDDPDIETDRKH
jgi:hypothetical protein